MADMLIRKVSEATKERLAAMAATSGISLEAIAREALDEKAARAPRPNEDDIPFGTWAASLFADGSGEKLAEILDNLEYAPERPFKFPDD